MGDAVLYAVWDIRLGQRDDPSIIQPADCGMGMSGTRAFH